MKERLVSGRASNRLAIDTCMQVINPLVVLFSDVFFTSEVVWQRNLLQNPSFEKAGLNRLFANCTLNDLPDWEFTPNNTRRCIPAGPDGSAVVCLSATRHHGFCRVLSGPTCGSTRGRVVEFVDRQC